MASSSFKNIPFVDHHGAFAFSKTFTACAISKSSVSWYTLSSTTGCIIYDTI